MRRLSWSLFAMGVWGNSGTSSETCSQDWPSELSEIVRVPRGVAPWNHGCGWTAGEGCGLSEIPGPSTRPSCRVGMGAAGISAASVIAPKKLCLPLDRSTSTPSLSLLTTFPPSSSLVPIPTSTPESLLHRHCPSPLHIGGQLQQEPASVAHPSRSTNSRSVAI